MLLPRFEFHEPHTVEEACRLMGELGETARPLAGGTDLLVNMKKNILTPTHLVSLGRIDGIRVMGSENGEFRVGAGVTAVELAESSAIRTRYPALAEGASRLGSPLIRNLATAAGNLVSARPAADLPPPLMAYGATITLRKASGERTLSLDDFFQGPGRTAAAPDEILESIHVEPPPPRSGAAYLKLGVRQTLEISIVNVAAFIALENESIRSARIVLGSVAPTPIRAPGAEGVLIGERPSEALFAKAAEAAALDARPIDDFRASAEYRRDMVRVLTQRTLAAALARAQSS